MELLVAISLLSVVTVLAYRGLDGLRRSQEWAATEDRHWQTLAHCFERFRADVLQASPRPRRRLDGNVEAVWLGTAATADASASLAFTRKPDGEGQDEYRLGYRLRESRLELLLWPTSDAAREATPHSYPLLKGVISINLSYLSMDRGWLDYWPPQAEKGADPAGRPRAVALRLVLADGTDFQRIFVLP